MLKMNRLSPMVISCALSAACAAPESSLEFKSGNELPAAASQNSQAGSQPTAAVVASTPPAAATVPPPAAAPTVAAATPPPAAAPSAPLATAPSPSSAGAAGSPALPSTTTAAKMPVTPTTPVMTNPMTLADGNVVYRIPNGTGNGDWNPRDKPIKVARGRTLKLIDDDKSVASGHWLHTNGQPCPHGLRAIGEGFDCVISNNAPLGVVFGTFEHNIANAGGQLYIDVVAAVAD